MTRVLVVDDEPQLVRALVINLRARRYEVDAASDGAGALELAAARHPDVVVLDLGLPDMDGTEVVAGLRGWTDVPILVLSGRSDSSDKVDALDAETDLVTLSIGGNDVGFTTMVGCITRQGPFAELPPTTTCDDRRRSRRCRSWTPSWSRSA